MLRTLGSLAIGLLIGFGLSRFIPELIKAPAEGYKSWPELYGPMIASTLVAIASFCGIYFTTWRNAEQKKLEMRIERLSKRIDTIATLVGAIHTYVNCIFNVLIARGDAEMAEEAYRVARGEDSSSYKEMQEAQAKEDEMVKKMQEASADVTRLAHVFGALPYDAQFPIHLGDTIQRWLRFCGVAMSKEGAAFPGKMTAVYDSRDELISYLRKTMDALATKRARLLGEEYIDFSNIDPPYFSKDSYKERFALKDWSEDEKEW